MKPILVDHHNTVSDMTTAKSCFAFDGDDSLIDVDHRSSPSTKKQTPCNPSPNLEPSSSSCLASQGSSATSATTWSSSSSRMDWTMMTTTTSSQENADRLSDGEESGIEALTTDIKMQMTLVPEESLPGGSSSSSVDVPNHPKGPTCSVVDVPIEPRRHGRKTEEEEEKEEEERSVPTSVQIHRAMEPPSPASRLRQSSGGLLYRSVSFHQVQIRRYPMIAGDNPACQMGAPVTLDWGFEELPALDLDDFEATRQQTRRRKLHHLILNYFQRNRILLGVGYTEEEIKVVEKGARNDRFRRDLTKLSIPLSKIEEMVQSIRRKMKRKMNKMIKDEKDELDNWIRMLREQDSQRLADSKQFR